LVMGLWIVFERIDLVIEVLRSELIVECVIEVERIVYERIIQVHIAETPPDIYCHLVLITWP
jgi:hypothetical protein